MSEEITDRRQDNSALWLVVGIAFLSTMGISSLLPVLPSIAEAFAVPLETSGLVIAVFAIPGFFLIPVTGVLADRFGRKMILFPSLLVFFLGGMGCLLATDFYWLLFFRFIQGAGSASFGTLCNTITADTWEGKQRVRMMGICGMSLGLGTAFSPALGGVLGILSWRFVFLLPLLAVPICFLSFKITLMKPKHSVSFSSYIRSSRECLKRPGSLPLIGLSFLTFILLSGPIVVCFPMMATEKFDASSLQIGIVLAGASLISGLAAMGIGRLYACFSARSILYGSQICYCLAMLLLPLMPGMWWLFIPILFYGFGQGLNIPLIATLLTGQAPDEQRGALMATNAMAHRFAQAVGPLSFGHFAGFIGAGPAIAVGAVICLAMLIVSIKAHIPALPSEAPPFLSCNE